MRLSLRFRSLRALRSAGLLAVVCGALALLPSCGGLDRQAVGGELGTIQSAANEGMLVADGAARARAPDEFTEIRCAELLKQSDGAGMTLGGTPTQAGLQEDAKRGASIATQVSDGLAALHSHPSSRPLAAQLRRKLGALAMQAGKIKQSL